jgi:hypothetical protein
VQHVVIGLCPPDPGRLHAHRGREIGRPKADRLQAGGGGGDRLVMADAGGGFDDRLEPDPPLAPTAFSAAVTRASTA